MARPEAVNKIIDGAKKVIGDYYASRAEMRLARQSTLSALVQREEERRAVRDSKQTRPLSDKVKGLDQPSSEGRYDFH